MLGTDQFGLAWRIVPVVLPVAGYFFILGLLNSRRHPQVLTGRRDFALMIAALAPVFVLPLLQWVGLSLLTLSVVGAALAAVATLLAPRGWSWVIYNMPPAQARRAVARVLRTMGVAHQPQGDGFDLEDPGARVRLSGSPLLRNVFVRLEGSDRRQAREFGQAMKRALAASEAETTPMAMTMLLIAVAIMVAPLTMVAQRVPEIVRILTDLLP